MGLLPTQTVDRLSPLTPRGIILSSVNEGHRFYEMRPTEDILLRLLRYCGLRLYSWTENSVKHHCTGSPAELITDSCAGPTAAPMDVTADTNPNGFREVSLFSLDRVDAHV